MSHLNLDRRSRLVLLGAVAITALPACRTASPDAQPTQVLPELSPTTIAVQYPGDQPRADWPTIVFEVPRGAVAGEPGWLFRQDMGGDDADVREASSVRERLLLAIEPIEP